MITAKEAREILPPNSKLVSEIPEYSYNKYHAIDIDGNVWSSRYGKWKLLKQKLDTKGYAVLGFFKDNKRTYFRLHRLCAMLFIDNPDNKPDINHKNGVRTDNRIKNLEWVTRSENIKHSFDVLNHKRLQGSKSCKAKLNEEKVKEIKTLLFDNISQRKIAKHFGVSHSIIGGINLGKRWAHVTPLQEMLGDDNCSQL